jgi:hypothetical protein
MLGPDAYDLPLLKTELDRTGCRQCFIGSYKKTPSTRETVKNHIKFGYRKTIAKKTTCPQAGGVYFGKMRKSCHHQKYCEARHD